MNDAEAGMANALKANPRDIAEQYETQLREPQEGHAVAEVSKKLQRHLDSTGIGLAAELQR